MKDVIVVASHPDSEDKLDNLYDLISFFSLSKKTIVLVSHLKIPEYILQKCDFYLFDKLNPKLPVNNNYCHTVTFNNPLLGIEMSPIDWQNIHSLGLLRLFFLAMSFCKMSGFNIAHYVESDSIFKSLEQIEKNNLLLENNFKNNGLVYVFPNSEFIHGAFFSINLNNFSNDKLIYDESNILLGLSMCKSVELFLLKFFFLDNVIKQPSSDLLECGSYVCNLSKQDMSRHKGSPCCLFKHKGDLYYFIYNFLSDRSILFDVLCSNKNERFILNPRSCMVRKISSDCFFVKFFIDNNFIRSYDLLNSETLLNIEKDAVVSYFNL